MVFHILQILDSSIQLSTVGIFALLTFVIPRQKEFISLSIKDLANALDRIASSFALQYLRADLYRNLDCFIARHSGPERGLTSTLHEQ